MSPFIVELGDVSPGLPPLVFGVIMAATSAVFLLLPETRGRPLPQSDEDVIKNMESGAMFKCDRLV